MDPVDLFVCQVRGVSMSLEGSQLGRYHLLRLLGRGAMGEVYLAQDTALPRQVAIKVIRRESSLEPALDPTSEAIGLFQHEMQMIARLTHPHILPLYDYGEALVQETLLPYMVMPFCQDGSLATWVKQRGQPALLSPREVAHLLQQAAVALQYAHEQHIVHRDVKPSNFLLHLHPAQPNRPHLLLADFGLARLSHASNSQSLTIGGTPPYMAPEQWRGHPVPASDQYMLAVMVYELLTGRTPFLGSLERLLVQHLQEPPEPPSRFNPQLPVALNAVVLQALAKQPEARFPGVAAFARAFEQALRQDSGSLANDPGATIGVNAPPPLPARKQHGLEAHPNNLPFQLTPLIGREREIKACCAQLKGPQVRLLTLLGTGGIGKTRLGLQVAAELLDTFADGVFFVDLAPLGDPSLVASSIAQALGVRETAGQPLLASLKEYLRTRQLLLVLDNFEHLLATAPMVTELLGVAPDLKVLVTSRIKLQLTAEQVFPVPLLQLPDPTHLPPLEVLVQEEAVALFVARAQAVKPSFTVTAANAEAVAQICGFCCKNFKTQQNRVHSKFL